MMESPKKPDSIKHFLNIVPQGDNTSKIFLDEKELEGVSKVDFMMDKETGGLQALRITFEKIGYKVQGDLE